MYFDELFTVQLQTLSSIQKAIGVWLESIILIVLIRARVYRNRCVREWRAVYVTGRCHEDDGRQPPGPRSTSRLCVV